MRGQRLTDGVAIRQRVDLPRSAMKVAFLRELQEGEKRVSAVPATVEKLVKAGIEVAVESEAGLASALPDAEYAKAGARIARFPEVLGDASAIVKVRPPLSRGSTHEVDSFPEGAILVSSALRSDETLREKLKRRRISGFSLDLLPRIARAQSMDVLSSMANIAGYKSVLLAANALGKFFPMLMTAAGTVTPARVFVLGAGVAGLQAIATARRLGAVVHAYDVRRAVKEQIESLGAKFVAVELDKAQAEEKGGYARELGEDFYRRQRELLTEVIAQQDVVIATAAVPGKRAPILITRDMLAGMSPGSVIVDLAAEPGGNCELTEPGRTIVEDGVTVMGPLNLPSAVPFHSSQMYSRNVAMFVRHLIAGGSIALNLEDEITRETLVTH